MAGAGDFTRVAGSVGGAVAAAPGAKEGSAAAAPASVAEEVEAEEFLLPGGRVEGRAGGGSVALEEEEAVDEVGESGRAVIGDVVVWEVEEDEERRGRVADEEAKGLDSSLGVASLLLSPSSSLSCD